MVDFLSSLLQMSVAGSLMILLLLLLRYVLFRKMPATVYYYLWILVLLRFVLPVPSVIEKPEPVIQPVYQQIEEIKPDAEGFDRIYVKPGAFEGAVMQADIAAESFPTSSKVEGIDSEYIVNSLSSLPWTDIIFILWFCGTVISLSHYIVGYLRFYTFIRRYRIHPELDDTRCYSRLRRRKKPELIRSDYVRTPMLMGVLRPLLVLPDAEYTQTQLENIFLHELMHYSRRDIVYKWMSVPVYAVQWFNPLCYLMRREINRACELSCDEMLIAGMDRVQKQSYGDTLISLASAGRLPAGIVATTFTTEKRDLKERLVKIMKFKERTFTSILALVLSVLLMAGCGAVTGPSPAEKVSPEVKPMTLAATVSLPESAVEDGAVVVSTVDELLAAIAPGASIRLEPGVYDLTTAADYGKTSEGKYYSWEEVYDGYELIIPGVDGLSITGSYVETTIATQPRYANVLRFVNCSDLRLEAVVVGHTEKQGFCSGGVVYLDSCENVKIDDCHLYGCGTIGIYAENCKSVYATGCRIYECSNNAVYALSSYAVVLENCDIHDCGESMVQSVFTADSCIGFAVINSNIYANTALHLIDSRYTLQASIQGCTIDENVFTEAMFWCDGYSVMVDDCEFGDLNRFGYFYDRGDGQVKMPPVNADGEELTIKDLVSMDQSEVSYEGPEEAEPVEIEEVYNEDGMRLVTVETVDEFLAAIDDNTTISLIGEFFDLSTASDYGAFGNENYYWFNVYDGPGLVINGVKNLRIVGNEATISAIPRYANVLSFVNCENIDIENLTAGHTEEPGSCAGGVLDFQNCAGVDIIDCHLYGCGILGISTAGCSDLYVGNTEIYECSQGAISLYSTRGAEFVNCDIHDCHSPEMSISDCSGVLYDGESLKYGAFKLENGKPVEFQW